MGQALYRKYRSKSLGDVIGQEHITTALSRALKDGHISHAYLLTGPRGVGKTSVARILAYEVNGLEYSEALPAHLDIIEIDAASNNGVEHIRDLREKVYVSPSSGKYKVYIIDEVHMLSKAAFNALLKTLEEPPAHVIFIMATTEAHKLPETIISRTQRYSFRPIDKQKVIDHLRDIAKTEKINISDEALELIAIHGEGSFRDSISMLDQIRNISGRIDTNEVLSLLGQAPPEMIAKLEDQLAANDKLALIVTLQQLQAQGYEAARIAKQLGQNFRNQLAGSETALPEHKILGLLAKLIEVPASPDPAISLEIALLESIETPAANFTAAVSSTLAQEVKSAQTPKTDQPKPPKAAAAKIEQPPAKIDGDIWPKILADIKKKHNTLYGVARMAQPAWDADKLTLKFKFAFHQKTVNNERNRKIFVDTIRDLTGRNLEVVCEHNASLPGIKPPADEPNIEDESQYDDAINTISNIFGGAELLES